jgi:hypothetical protein
MITVLSVVAVLLITSHAYADIPTATELASVGPNATSGSPSWNGYVANALVGLENGGAQAGTPGTPTYYAPTTGPITVAQTLVTSFHSWNGTVNPAAPFDQEYGSRVMFGIDIKGNGNKISLSELTAQTYWVDQTGAYAWENVSYSGSPYAAHRIGLIYNDGAPPTIINSGLNTQLVDEIVTTGYGGGIWAMYDDINLPNSQDKAMLTAWGLPGYTGATLQERYDSMLSILDSTTPFGWRIDYSIDYNHGVAPAETFSYTQQIVPEPGTLALLGTAGLGLLCYAWRRRRAKG